ncbi:uncharacterized protein LOC109727144 [Ananas comosus]|uniref:Uncharacterized protein LOC109727144 n=1 Tax=Ananas comosus TaxID=4615 RepID=A0A6P5H5K0_ANACO|nr:uncharacterized protein LOC109727144 [Ananas comosus]
MSPSPPRTALLVLLLLVFIAVVCKETTHASALNAATTMGVSPQKMERIQRYLEKINKPAVKSIKSPDGDIIDCVLMNKQLALDHPLLKNHKIQVHFFFFLEKNLCLIAVYPEFYGDSTTRLFIYWTRDAYNTTGCYNLWCPGFVQTNNQVVLGGTIAPPLSTYDAYQREITLLVWKDASTGNWWLSYDNIDVGYWPAAIFTQLVSYATSVQWGGEIVNNDVNGQHTTTQMGSGHFAEEGYQKASYFRNVEVVNSANGLYSPSISPSETNANCYDIAISSTTDWGTYFYYGGPGRNPKCP